MHSSQEHYEQENNEGLNRKMGSLKRKAPETLEDVQEAVDSVDIPSELVQLLKLYHRFLEKVRLQEEQIRKDATAYDQFLEQVDLTDETDLSEAMYDPSFDVFSEYDRLFRDTCKLTRVCKDNVLKLRKKMETLEKRYGRSALRRIHEQCGCCHLPRKF